MVKNEGKLLKSDEHLGLPVNLSADIELLPTLWEQSSAGDDGVWAHDFLVVCKSLSI